MSNQILLVEDNPDMAQLLLELLEWGGQQVTLARTGEEAVAILEGGQFTPNLIISDLTMPHMDGLQLLIYVRQNPHWETVRFVMMSANPHDPRFEAPEAAYLDGVLPKPFTLNDFNQLLRQ